MPVAIMSAAMRAFLDSCRQCMNAVTAVKSLRHLHNVTGVTRTAYEPE